MWLRLFQKKKIKKDIIQVGDTCIVTNVTGNAFLLNEKVEITSITERGTHGETFMVAYCRSVELRGRYSRYHLVQQVPICQLAKYKSYQISKPKPFKLK